MLIAQITIIAITGLLCAAAFFANEKVHDRSLVVRDKMRVIGPTDLSATARLYVAAAYSLTHTRRVRSSALVPGR